MSGYRFRCPRQHRVLTPALTSNSEPRHVARWNSGKEIADCQLLIVDPLRIVNQNPALRRLAPLFLFSRDSS